MSSCINCGTPLNGHFCYACGQKSAIPRITLKNLIHNLFAIITNVEHGFWFTFKALFTRPEQVIREYIAGNRVKYYHPIRYFIIWMGISTLLSLSTGVFDTIVSQFNQISPMADDPEIVRQQAEMQKRIKAFLNFIPLLLLPFLSAVSFWMFRKRSYNYAEHLTMITFMTSQVTIIGIPIIGIYYFFPSILTYSFAISILVNAIYFGWIYHRLFQLKRLSSILVGLAVAFFGLVLMYIILGILGIIIGFLIALIL